MIRVHLSWAHLYDDTERDMEFETADELVEFLRRTDLHQVSKVPQGLGGMVVIPPDEDNDEYDFYIIVYDYYLE